MSIPFVLVSKVEMQFFPGHIYPRGWSTKIDQLGTGIGYGGRVCHSYLVPPFFPDHVYTRKTSRMPVDH